jgi:hypothetical protein
LIAAHEERRRSLQKHIAETLERFRAGRWPDVQGGS